jgi:hypothetical protein
MATPRPDARDGFAAGSDADADSDALDAYVAALRQPGSTPVRSR